MLKPKFGIVQGRLSKPPANQLQWFPQENWKEEIKTAAGLKLEFVELLVEREFNNKNPFWTESGRSQIFETHKKYELEIFSICNDYIINNNLADIVTQTKFIDFLQKSAELNCKLIVVPLLEESSLNTETISELRPVIKVLAREAKGLNIHLCIESLLSGHDLKSFVESIDEPNLTVVFDTGNRILENTDLASEIKVLGDHIGHVHIKDKNILGENVLLGTGLVNFNEIFVAFKEIKYQGPYVFETTRGLDPINTAKYHLNFCKFFIQNAD